MDDLARDVLLAQDALNDAEVAYENLTDLDLERGFVLYERLGELIRVAQDVKKRLANDIGEAIQSSGWLTFDGKSVRGRYAAKRTKWDNESLFRAVMDSRPPADPETGEIPEETPLDKVRACWPLSGSSVRVGVLKERGIDADEFCQTRPDGFTLEVQKSERGAT